MYHYDNFIPILSDDQQYLGLMSEHLCKYTTRIVDMRTKKIIKTFDDYQLIDFSKDNKFINGIYLN